jgi:hypothetical protein
VNRINELRTLVKEQKIAIKRAFRQFEDLAPSPSIADDHDKRIFLKVTKKIYTNLAIQYKGGIASVVDINKALKKMKNVWILFARNIDSPFLRSNIVVQHCYRINRCFIDLSEDLPEINASVVGRTKDLEKEILSFIEEHPF